MNKRVKPRYDVGLVRDDMEARGWMLFDLAREVDLSGATITRFMKRQRQTPKTAKKIARVFGREPEYYLIRRERAVA